MKLRASPAAGLSRLARVEPCHWAEGYVGVSLQERRATMQVMLGMSLRARWDTTLALINQDRSTSAKLMQRKSYNTYMITSDKVMFLELSLSKRSPK